jgi:hypothetical protein
LTEKNLDADWPFSTNKILFRKHKRSKFLGNDSRETRGLGWKGANVSYIGPRWWMSFYFLIWPPSCKKHISVSTDSSLNMRRCPRYNITNFLTESRECSTTQFYDYLEMKHTRIIAICTWERTAMFFLELTRLDSFMVHKEFWSLSKQFLFFNETVF